MKRNRQFLFALVAFVFATSAASAQIFTFDFNSLENRDRDRPISDYMTAIYGSQIEVDGARVTNETSVPGVETDLFIATSLQLLNRGDFSIDFLSVPILAVRFEGHVLDPTIGDDFRMRAFNGDAEVHLFTRDSGEETFDSGWIMFNSPVDRLVFSDSGRKDVGVDDLTVQIVPEPATVGLLMAGLAVASLRRRNA